MHPLTLQAPAKLNLTLKLQHKRADGFHELETLITQLPDLADVLSFSLEDSFSFTCSDPRLPTDESNLVIKAVRAFEHAAELAVRCRIKLEKHIPHGAGLGGGSSDAATTLMGLNQLHGEPLSMAQLNQLAAEIGSDVPFFLGPAIARCSGRGEIVHPAERMAKLPVLLLKPMFSVSAGEAYRRWNTDRSTTASQQLDQLVLSNDLEAPVFAKFPFLAELKQWLQSALGVRAAQMSGSGTTIFAVLEDTARPAEIARAARQDLDPTLWVWWGETAAHPG